MAKGNRTGKGYFQPGNCANPGGRPAIVKQVRELLQEQVPANIEKLVAIRDDPNSKASDVLVAIRELNDRAMGRAPQAVEHSGAIGSGNGPGDHTPDIAQQPNLRGLRERVIAQPADRQVAVTAAVAEQNGQAIQQARLGTLSRISGGV
jgi:hypothetical protein